MADITEAVDRKRSALKNVLRGKPLPALASTFYPKGMLVCADTNGRAIDAGDASSVSCVLGVVTEDVDNSSGSNDDLTVPYEYNLEVDLTNDSLTASNLGARVFATDNTTVAAAAGTDGKFAGWLKEVVSSSVARVFIPGVDHIDTTGA